MKKPKIPQAAIAPPAPPPKALPSETDPDPRAAEIEAERSAKKRRGRSDSLLSGLLAGNPGSYGAPTSTMAKAGKG